MALHMQRWIQRRLSASQGSAVGLSVLSSRMFIRGNRSLFSVTSPLLEKKIINVPTMGDSITEGTIVEWTASVGEAVKEGDVVALVETDKVTVDIKADMDGVIVSQFGAVDDTVEVGAKLYEIDTEAEAAAEAPTAIKTGVEQETETPMPAAFESSKPATESETSPSPHRNPLIHFLGKQGWADRLAGRAEEPSSQPDVPKSLAATVSLDGSDIDPMYGRVPFTEKEMEALILGGAETTPHLVTPSTAATFAP